MVPVKEGGIYDDYLVRNHTISEAELLSPTRVKRDSIKETVLPQDAMYQAILIILSRLIMIKQRNRVKKSRIKLL